MYVYIHKTHQKRGSLWCISHVHVCVCLCVYAYIHIHIYVNVYTKHTRNEDLFGAFLTCVCVCVYAYIHTYTYTCLHKTHQKRELLWRIPYVYVCVCVCVRVCTHTYTHIHIRTKHTRREDLSGAFLITRKQTESSNCTQFAFSHEQLILICLRLCKHNICH